MRGNPDQNIPLHLRRTFAEMPNGAKREDFASNAGSKKDLRTSPRLESDFELRLQPKCFHALD